MAKAVKTIDLVQWSDSVATMSLEQFKVHAEYYAKVGTVTVKPTEAAIKKAHEAAVKKALKNIESKKTKE